MNELPQKVIDRYFMQLAYEQTLAAERCGQLGIGCVIAKNNLMVAFGHNRIEMLGDKTRHAELGAIQCGANTHGAELLEGATIYTTLEPCGMCYYGAVFQGIGRIVYAASDPRLRERADISLNYKRDQRPDLEQIPDQDLVNTCFALYNESHERLRTSRGK